MYFCLNKCKWEAYSTVYWYVGMELLVDFLCSSNTTRQAHAGTCKHMPSHAHVCMVMYSKNLLQNGYTVNCAVIALFVWWMLFDLLWCDTYKHYAPLTWVPNCCYSNRLDVNAAVNHPWLDIGHSIKLKSDETVFPAVEFSALTNRLDSLKKDLIKAEPIAW